MIRASVLALFAAGVFTPSLSAQSLFGSQGLGLPLDPLDARARALGTVGVGLMGPSLSPTNLAAAARILLPTAQMTVQPHWVDGDLAGQPLKTRATRFPQMGIAYPVPVLRGTALLHVGSYLDQRWEMEQESMQEFQGGEYPVTDLFKSTGGVSTVQLGWAHRLREDLSLGAGIGTRIGSVSRTFQRTIDTGGLTVVVPFRTGGQWQYSGVTASVGFQWDPISALRLGGALNWSGELEAKPSDDTAGEAITFNLPTEYRLGASGILTSRLVLSAGVSYADWRGSNEFLGADAVVGPVWSFGAGIEWAGPQWGIRNFPVRFGMRKTDLPFTFDGENPTESAFTGGIGLDLIPAQSGLVGGIDLGFERGTREAGSLSESFWRATVTFRVGSF
jgi:hypothetical protein